MGIDISVTVDPVSWLLETIVIVILIRWLRFEKKETKKRPRKKKSEVTVIVPTNVKFDKGEENDN